MGQWPTHPYAVQAAKRRQPSLCLLMGTGGLGPLIGHPRIATPGVAGSATHGLAVAGRVGSLDLLLAMPLVQVGSAGGRGLRGLLAALG